LGPLLFLVFINDIVYVVRHCKIRMFADDTCLFIEVDNRDEAAAHINEDLEGISHWADDWLITFSPPKTKSLTISNKTHLDQHPDLYLDGHKIDKVDHHKHLGVFLSHNLRWNCHINELVTSTSKKLSLMQGLKYKLDRRSLEIVYTSFIRPCLEYADVLWAGTYDTDLMKIDTMQIEAMRIVTGATARSNINKLFEESGWASLQERRIMHVQILMYKIVNNLAPSYLRSLIPTTVGEGTNYGLRNNNAIRVPFARTESYKRSFIPVGINEWNILPATVQDMPTLQSFKEAIKRQHEPKELYYSGERWPAIHHARTRMGCSKLNAHLCNNLHVVPSPRCQCGYEIEDSMHFYLQCPTFLEQRTKMIRTIAAITAVSLDTILYGNPNLNLNDNKRVFKAVHTFILESNRFTN